MAKDKPVIVSPAPNQASELPQTAVAVVETAEQPTSLSTMSSMEDMFLEDAGGGLRNLGANDYAIPFISILQKGSPQVSRANSKHIKGAVVGMLMNTVTSELYDAEDGIDGSGILFIPCGYQKQLVRWKPRDSGGGLVCHYKEGDPALKAFTRNERGQLVDPVSKDIIVDTAYHFGLLLRNGLFPEFTVISMYSTQLKKSRMWNTLMRRVVRKSKNGTLFNPPSYASVYRIQTIGEVKDQYDFYGYKITGEGEVTDPDLYKLARNFAKQIEAGEVKVSAPPSDFNEVPGETLPSDDVPF